MSNNTSNSQRIAKNTILLYVRMLFLMLISLYTSRVILNALGVEDYGIYNVVGGMVTLLTVLTGSLSASISRFLTFELGTGNIENLKKIFSSSVTIQVILALFIILIAETIGVWFLNNKMTIPVERLTAANWCFQFSVLSFTIGLISVPYNALIIAHEKMSAFAYISIFEGIGKLLIAWSIAFNPIDKLVFYAAMVALLALVIRAIYSSYCKRKFIEATFHFCFDSTLLRRMFSFAGWNFFGAASGRLMFQGMDVLSNVFFGVAVNAARGVATQVDTAIQSFVNNFTVAINPQITKSYASKDMDYMYSLMFRGAKLSFYLILFFAVPILCETQILLKIWLNIVPNHTVNFVRLAIIISMIGVLSNTMVTAMLATGDIKKYQIIVGGVGMLVLPISWLFFTFGSSPEMGYITVVIIYLIQFVCRLLLLKKMISMSILDYFKQVVYRALLVFLISMPIPLFIRSFMEESLLRFAVVILVSIASVLLAVYFVGLSSSEKSFIFGQLRKVGNNRSNNNRI